LSNVEKWLKDREELKILIKLLAGESKERQLEILKERK